MITSRIRLTSRSSAPFRPFIIHNLFFFLFFLLSTIGTDTLKVHERHPSLVILIPAVITVPIELLLNPIISGM
jgi:hypothetical protein